jgi:cation diffusion facilitator family transporter
MAESRTAVMAALLGNAALAVMKGVAAVSTGSAAMVAETFHSVADTGNQVLLFLGLRLSERPPDRAHGFGHGRDVYFWAFVVSLMLFSLGGAFSIWEGVRKLLHGGPHEGSRWWSYAVLVGAFIFESSSLAVAWRALASARGRKSLRGFWRDNRDPTVPTVVFEDTAALVSLGIAALGIWLSQMTGAILWDAVASIVIGTLLVGVAVVLALENYSLLLGEAAPAAVEARIRRLVREDHDVLDVVDLRTMHMGPREILVALGVHFRPHLTTAQIEAAVARLQTAIKKALDGATDAGLILVEPTRPRVAGSDKAA